MLGLSLLNPTTAVQGERSLSPQEHHDYVHQVASKQLDWLAARVAAKKVVSRYYKQSENQPLDLRDIEVVSRPLTPPQLRVQGVITPSLKLSLSHSHQCGVAGINRGLIGVDVERIRLWQPSLLGAWLTEEEVTDLASRPAEQNRTLIPTLLWSIKEAYLKAIGQGLRQHPQTITVRLTDTLQVTHILDHYTVQPVITTWFTTHEYVVVKVTNSL